MEDLGGYADSAINWGLRTGGNFAVIDFDDEHSFIQFAVANVENLPENTPIVKTGRGYHVWFRPTQPIKDQHFDGIDIKGDGGQVVAPPSIHPKTGKRYKFIWQLGDSIPDLDITKLKFPELKKRTNEGSSGIGNAVIRDGGHKVPTDKPRFDFSLIEDGVDEGQRHSALVSYIGYLIWRGLSKTEITILVSDWNERNRPPISKSELESTVDYCYARYAKDEAHDNSLVSTKTLSQIDSVIVETKPYPRIDRRHPLYTPESPNPTSEPEQTDPWQLEDVKTYDYRDCGKRRSIIRKGREYLR